MIGKYILFDNNSVLTVTDVQNVSDTGVYQCMSENSVGVLLEEAILMVNGKVSQWLLDGNYLIMDFHAVENSKEKFMFRYLSSLMFSIIVKMSISDKASRKIVIFYSVLRGQNSLFIVYLYKCL